ncbi:MULTISPECIES: helix-turn-helix domain-containing protein [Lactiplantibacillus]|uniref:helix-turn-helix domain-containing protein n=1 Tax=Lactiplantibacillus TaxID=2767842 RepID=UPI001C1F10D5|nr:MULTISPECIES: helix-turn-helix transcriptional regulator [Lactiplantibacillus]MBU7461513.1 helix-turn-helix transcriptional regulator [Lactiplantibacillus pentosus]MBU7478063.1 helix-turn-helix transcriptional regulator [Lactiplantibacillus pentosus]MBU7484618.1 helix-turn-helix transcriptional regulator [Lactiplantibacillus sp. 30.2.29]MBU7488059.1 helix-turn-helix transcriptional regulator [Lactiplantibacillus pentosus]MBU7501161.1 helix-turn-helix transcriptional regulator [Lactiplantiba
MTVLDRIKKVSKKRGFSLTQVNDKANLGKNTIYSWKVKEPSINNLKAVADVLNVSVDYLLGKTDDNSTSKKPKHVDIADDDVIMTFEGKPIPPEDLELMKRLLRGGRNND